MMVDNPSEEWPEIVFFDLEAAFVNSPDSYQTFGSPIVEFGAVVVCRRTLTVKASYSTLVRPACQTFISCLDGRSNGINPMTVESAPPFSEIADNVHKFLHERTWAGHNILDFDCLRIKEAFEEIGRSPPEAKGYIDTLQLWKERLGNRTGDMKMETIAAYFGLGKQKHRSLDDAMLNFELFKHCAGVLWLELNPDRFLEPGEVSISSIGVSGAHWGQKMILLHKDMALKLFCPRLRVRYGLVPRENDDGRPPSLTFVIDASPVLCNVVDECSRVAREVFLKSGSSSEWKPMVTTYGSYLTVRLRIPTRANNVTAGFIVVTRIQRVAPCGTIEELEFTESNIAELSYLLEAGCIFDAYIALDPYDYYNSAGVRLIVEKLIIRDE